MRKGLLAVFLLLGAVFNGAWAVVVALDTDKGLIKLNLFEKESPRTVENFLRYVDEGFYDGLIFHRVIDGFMIQAGAYDENLKLRDASAPIANESYNGLENKRGRVAMARTADPHSATTQFFINQVDNDYLNPGGVDSYGYTVFAEVIEGMEVVDEIAKLPTTARGPFARDFPVELVRIKRVYRVEEE